MSKYDSLDARTELEQAVASDLRSALEKRGYTVRHNGTATSHAPGGMPDIVVEGARVILTIETTKSKGAQQDRELNAIRDHLNATKRSAGSKKCYCLYVAPDTTARMLDGIRDHNQQRQAERKTDLRILPLAAETLELWLTRLADAEASLYPVDDFLRLFEQKPAVYVDDLRIRKLLVGAVFPHDLALAGAMAREEIERDQRTLEQLIVDLARLEDLMRQGAVAVGQAAIDNLIYLVFLKLYEEKRGRDGKTDRLHSVEAFGRYREDGVDARTRRAQRAIHKLLRDVTSEGDFTESGMFSSSDRLAESVNDDFVLQHVIPTLSKYNFVGTRIDALGAVYEVLARRAAKDVKVGQFFTPENVVRFMVDLVQPDYRDVVLDPACGTGRFLIYAMQEMFDRLERSAERQKARVKNDVCATRLVGSDIDIRIAKIAKMNMWFHGDGRSNIFGGRDYNGLLLHQRQFFGNRGFDGAFDIVLTNPPLGDLNYQALSFVSAGDEQEHARQTHERMSILPWRNLSQAQHGALTANVAKYRAEVDALTQELVALRNDATVREYLALEESATTRAAQARRSALRRTAVVATYVSTTRSLQKKRSTLLRNERAADDIRALLQSGTARYEITGNTLKGGALFLNAIWHYLKSASRPEDRPEWRGGKLAIVLDEGILNTDNYQHVRDFVRERFYIKAVISLTRDAFVPISKTTTKTSILYVVKKTDLRAVQKEPIFYGHVEHVGVDTKGRACQNDLPAMLAAYHRFRDAVSAAYAGDEFRSERFRAPAPEVITHA
jgi:type I restriction-modification system DNA methylase subunit